MNKTENKENKHTIPLKLCDFILTPLSCANVINEVLKIFLYQKSQIPYTYNWLKSIMLKKRQNGDSGEALTCKNFKVQNHFRIVSNTFDTIEKLILNIFEMMKTEYNITEIVFVIGATPFSPKEAFSIRINGLNLGHNENNHVLECKRNQHKILRQIFLSDIWMESTGNNLGCTNTYIFLKKTVSETHHEEMENSFFVPCQSLFLSSRVKHIIIDLISEVNMKFSCCSNLEIFNDIQNNVSKSEDNKLENNLENFKEAWFQAKTAIQGFKDCYVNQVSASKLW